MSTRSHHRYRQHLQAPTSADDARRHRNCFGPFRRVIGAGVSTDDTDFLYLLASSVQVSDCAPVRTSVGARRESWMVLFGSVRHVRQSPHRCPSIVWRQRVCSVLSRDKQNNTKGGATFACECSGNWSELKKMDAKLALTIEPFGSDWASWE